MSAAQQVFDTPELLEEILLGLSMLDIICLQRVSKQWQATTLGSVLLQRKLFFIAERGELLHFHSPSSDNEADKNDNDSIKSNALSREAFWYQESNPWKPLSVVQNPIIERLERHIEPYMSPSALAANRGQLLPEVWLRRESSWRRMHLSQRRIKGTLWTILRDQQLPCFDAIHGLHVHDSSEFLLGNALDEMHSGLLARRISDRIKGRRRPPGIDYTRLLLEIEGLGETSHEDIGQARRGRVRFYRG
jgi:hypothetical protein